MARILVVDDEEKVRFSLRAALEDEAHDVSEAENGAVAMDLVTVGAFDLVVTDIVMPEKEGIQTILELKSGFPEIKVIAITGGNRERRELYAATASTLGADEVLQKPFTHKALVESVDRCLAKT